MKTREQFLAGMTPVKAVRLIQQIFRRGYHKHTVVFVGGAGGKETATLWNVLNAALRNERKHRSTKSKP